MKSKSSDSTRLIAVDHVELESDTPRADEMRTFYGDLLGLAEALPIESDSGPIYRFRSERVELRINPVKEVSVDSLSRRVWVQVREFEQLIEDLDARKWDYDLFRGVQFTDLRIEMLDPVGHRVVVRRHWPGTLL